MSGSGLKSGLSMKQPNIRFLWNVVRVSKRIIQEEFEVAFPHIGDGSLVSDDDCKIILQK